MNNLKKVILVTGASSGIGLRTSELLAKNNFNIIASMRDINGKNSDKAEELNKLGADISVIELDVSSCSSVEKAIKAIIKKYDCIDVVINNAGIMNVGLAEGFTIKQLEKQMNVNYIGVARLFRETLPYMRKRKKGLFVTISSIAGRIVFPFLSTYNPSKFAVEALAEIYRYELSPFNIDSIIIEPGPFATDLVKNSPRPENVDVLKDYGTLASAADQTMQHFKQFMKNNPECDPSLVSEKILELINIEYGKRPLRTTCGVDYGVSEVNKITEKYQFEILKQMDLEDLIPKKESG